MSGNGYVNYVNIKPGKDGAYIKDGILYVEFIQNGVSKLSDAGVNQW